MKEMISYWKKTVIQATARANEIRWKHEKKSTVWKLTSIVLNHLIYQWLRIADNQLNSMYENSLIETILA